MSAERRNLLKAYGASLMLTEGAQGMKGAIAKADELAHEIKGSVILGQFVNPANPAIHKATTGPEIWKQTGGQMDIFVAGVVTDGTITGVGKYLREKIRILRLSPWNRRTTPYYRKVWPEHIKSMAFRPVLYRICWTRRSMARF